MKKVSLNDIAQNLGVSKALVSLVLNNRGNENGISKETQKKVLEKALELNYKPNQIARGLRLGRSQTLALIVADISNPFYSKIARRIEDTASKYGYHLLVCSSDENPKKETELINMVTQRQVDGLIISTTHSDTGFFNQLIAEKTPFILIDRYLARLNTNQVTANNTQGAIDAVEHLLALGHDKIAFFSISPSHLSTMIDRLKGYKEALGKHNIRYTKKLVREISFQNVKSDVELHLRELLSLPQSVSALITGNNSIAKACLQTFAEMKIRIPQDMAIISFDDIDLFSFSYPTITAIAQPVEEIGEIAVDILLELIKNPDQEAKQFVLPMKLQIRQSCGNLLRNGL